MSNQPSSAKPVGVGPAATGGQQLRLHISLFGFSAPVDIYFGLYAPAISPSVWILQPDGVSLKPAETDFNPWKSAETGAVDQYLFGDIPVDLLPAGRYTFYLLATAPPGALSFYYLWSTWVEISESGLAWTGCPEHGILHGTLYVHILEPRMNGGKRILCYPPKMGQKPVPESYPTSSGLGPLIEDEECRRITRKIGGHHKKKGDIVIHHWIKHGVPLFSRFRIATLNYRGELFT